MLESKHFSTLGRTPHRQFYHGLTRLHVTPAQQSTFAAQSHRQFTQVQQQFSHDFMLALVQYEKAVKTLKLKRSLRPATIGPSLGQLLKLLRDSYDKSYRLGLASSHHPGYAQTQYMSAEEKRWVESAVRHELRYLHGMLSDIKSGRSITTMVGRARMYADTLGSLYHTGRVSGQSADTEIYWRLDPGASHCDDCLELSRLSPFVKDTLPTTPKAGACRCLSRCACQLEFVPSSPAAIAAIRRNNLNARYILARFKRRRRLP